MEPEQKVEVRMLPLWVASCRKDGCTWESNPHGTEPEAQDSLQYHDFEVHQQPQGA